MGMLTMFFAAPVAEVPSRNLNEGVPATYPSQESRFIDEMKVAFLESILTGRDSSDCMKSLINRCVYTHDESGISVVQLTDELAKALAALTPENAMDSATKWMASGQWKGFGRRMEDLRSLADLLAIIGKLARTSQAPGYGLFFWVCP
jgi:hypothetical protein